jgi:hypothetical protein
LNKLIKYTKKKKKKTIQRANETKT